MQEAMKPEVFQDQEASISLKVCANIYLKARLKRAMQLLVDVFHQEAVYYGRWRDFRSEVKEQDEQDVDAVEADDLADELDLFGCTDEKSADIMDSSFHVISTRANLNPNICRNECNLPTRERQIWILPTI